MLKKECKIKSIKALKGENSKSQNQVEISSNKADYDENKPFYYLDNNAKGFYRYKGLFLKYRKYIDSVLMRAVFIAAFSFHIYYIGCIYDNKTFYVLYLSSPIIIIDGVYILYKRHGHDYYWFSISIATYSITMVFIIIFEMDVKYQLNDIYCNTNKTKLSSFASCFQFTGSLSICTLNDLVITGFMVYSRWILPVSKRMNSEAVYNQIAIFTSSAADVVELANYMQKSEVIDFHGLIRAVQVVFGLSVSQFSFSLGAVKKRNLKLTGVRKLIDVMLSVEAWALLLTVFTQELPSCILRFTLILSLASNNDYSLYFFMIKNNLMTVLLIYRSFVLIRRQYVKERTIQPVE